MILTNVSSFIESSMVERILLTGLGYVKEQSLKATVEWFGLWLGSSGPGDKKDNL
jgi:hypothetical protein